MSFDPSASPGRVALLAGTERCPEVRLWFGRDDRHLRNGERLADWVKKAPRRHWNGALGYWTITAFGGVDGVARDPQRVLAAAGFQIIIEHEALDPSLRGTFSLTDLVNPMCRQSQVKPGIGLVRPRFAGWDVARDILGLAAVWDRDAQRFEVPLSELLVHGDPKPGLVIDPATVEAARAGLSKRPQFGSDKHGDEVLTADAASLALSSGLDLTSTDADSVDRLAEVVGDVPDWFGKKPFPYQRLGAIAVCSGRSFLADPTGLGKGSPESTKILGPHGWTTYGTVVVGDEVIGSDGTATTVTGVFPRGNLPVHRVVFEDGASVVVDGDHLWPVVGRNVPVETRDLRPGDRMPVAPAIHFSPRDEDPGPVHAFEAGRAGIVPGDNILFGSMQTRHAYLNGFRSQFGSPPATTVELADAITSIVRSLGAVVDVTGPSREATFGQLTRAVARVEPAGTDRVVCISVAAADRLYVTEDFLLTHNTIQAIAALSIKDVDRAIVLVPPVVLTNWEREIVACGLAVVPDPPKKRKKAAASTANAKTTARSQGLAEAGSELAPPSIGPNPNSSTHTVPANSDSDKATGQRPPRQVVVIRAGRKEPELPDRGIVVVADSLVTSREALRHRLAAWGPDALVYDEAHRARNLRSARTKAVIDLSERLPVEALRLPMTATPLFSNPSELVPLLMLSGHIGPIFGGPEAFIDEYCERNHFNALVAKKSALPKLRKMLAEHVWVRRKKDEVLPDLPKVMWSETYVDVNLAGYQEAHLAVIAKILVWVDEYHCASGSYPDEEKVREFSRSQIGLMSPLRKAAGLAKVPVALDFISDWIQDEVTYVNGQAVCGRPLLVWAHHEEVITSLVEHAAAHLRTADRPLVGVINGAASSDRRGQLVDQFQAGQLPVLICSIAAAGVGITLTYGCDQIHLESDFSPPVVSQAIDRQVRIGQERPVSVNFFLAEGTLDARLHQILQAKAVTINEITGDNEGSVSNVNVSRVGTAKPSELIAALAEIAIDQHARGIRPALAAA